MSRHAILISLASVCLLTNCTPREDVVQDGASAGSTTPVITETTDEGSEIQDGAADGGAGEIDNSVAAAYKIQSKADIDASVSAMMTLADKDASGQLSADEFDIIAPALGQADNSVTPSAEGGPLATPGAGDNMETSTASPIRADEFFAETAGPDGLISSSELAAALTSRFDSADADGNGEFTPAEAQNFAASMLFSRE